MSAVAVVTVGAVVMMMRAMEGAVIDAVIVGMGSDTTIVSINRGLLSRAVAVSSSGQFRAT